MSKNKGNVWKLIRTIGVGLMGVSGAILALPTGGISVPASVLAIASLLGGLGTTATVVSKAGEEFVNATSYETDKPE
jgi:hypothetical protein